MQSGSPWHIPGFRPLFAASATSHLGTDIAYVTVPLVAVTTLDASTAQVGFLGVLSTIAFVLIGLPAGVWIDQLPHRRVLIVADVSRAVLLASVPIAWWLGVLSFAQLCAVALLNGMATVFFNICAQSALPRIAGPDNLVAANTRIYSLMAGSLVAGRTAGGWLAQLLGPPAAVAFAAAGYVASGRQLAALPASAAPDPAAARPRRHRDEISVGFRHVLGHPELRPLAITVALTNFGAQMVNTVLPVLFTRELGLPAFVLGFYWALVGVGNLLGAYCARPVAARVGYGRTIGLAGLCLAPWALLIPMIDNGIWLWTAALGWLLATTKMGIDNVLGISLRQARTPAAMQGRMNATVHVMFAGAMALGAATAGLIGQYAGIRTALWAGGICLAFAFVPVFLSPVRKLAELPAT